MNTVCVLGANSFSGQDFVDLLLDDPAYRVIGVSRSPERSSLFLKYRTRADLSRYSYHALDLNRDMPELLDLLAAAKPDAVVNFAAQSEVAPSWDHPEHWFETNTVALAKLVNWLRRQSFLKRYVHISSPEAYGTCVGTVMEDAPLNPSTPYAASKAAADFLLATYAKQWGFPLLTVRATTSTGRGSSCSKSSRARPSTSAATTRSRRSASTAAARRSSRTSTSATSPVARRRCWNAAVSVNCITSRRTAVSKCARWCA
jgi:dTDP-glucose 4,6-dehydratase